MDSLCSPIVQNAAASSCICFYCSHRRHIWTMGGLNIVSWFVVIHFGSLVVHLGFSLISNASTVSDQSKQTIYVKIPLCFLISYFCTRAVSFCFQSGLSISVFSCYPCVSVSGSVSFVCFFSFLSSQSVMCPCLFISCHCVTCPSPGLSVCYYSFCLDSPSSRVCCV